MLGSRSRKQALAALLACTLCACNGQRKPSDAAPAVSVEKPDRKTADTAVAQLRDDVWRGVCYAHSWERGGDKGYGSEESASALDHLETVGVDWVSVTPFGFMGDTDETVVRGEHMEKGPRGAETAARVTAVVEQAHARNMKVMLKPHIWIRGGKWRGRIKPINDEGKLDWKAWWDSHDAWILYYAELAAKLDVAALVVGLELHTAVQAHPERLVQLAEKVRKIYDGHVTYSANWNEPVPDDVWLAMDSVGVQFYPPLVKERGGWSDAEVTANLRKYLDEWNTVAERVGKPFVITEVGYRSAEIAVSHPNAWPEKMKADTDEERQADAYRAFFAALNATPELRGVFLWKYFTNADTDEEGPTGFSPRGKPAEAVVRAAFGGTDELATEPTP